MSTSISFTERYGPWALVAGASEGLGAEFAEQLAERGLNLVLLARRGDVLAELGAKLERAHGIKVRTHAIDLGHPDLVTQLRVAIDSLEIGLLVYNAALASIGPFLARPLEEKLKVLDVNCRAPVILAHELGLKMAARHRGGIILMSSLAGSQGTPIVATYSATKAFNLVLAEALWDELAEHGIDVLACRAGSTDTPGYQRSQPVRDYMVLPTRQVVAETLEALGHGPAVVPGLGNRLSAFFLGRFLPRKVAVRILGRATRSMFPQSR